MLACTCTNVLTSFHTLGRQLHFKHMLYVCTGCATTYYSIDSPKDESETHAFPPEFLNALDPHGLPAHKVEVKTGMMFMILRNLCPSKGLANGTRVVVRECMPHVIKAEVLSGEHKGEICFIPRITISSEADPQVPFTFIRKQFPIKPAFAITINKAQGQTLQKVGVYLPHAVFTHGQLYVAMSRVGDPHAIKLFIVNGWKDDGPEGAGVYTDNVVFPEVFEDRVEEPPTPPPADVLRVGDLGVDLMDGHMYID